MVDESHEYRKEDIINKTSIEWCRNPDGSPGYTWNVITGCLGPKGDGVHCPYCYARRLANGRLKQRYLANNDGAPQEDILDYGRDMKDPFYPRFWEGRIPQDKYITFKQIDRVKEKPKGIFVCDMGELFGDWLPQEWQEQIFRVITFNPWHRFYLLTKQPQNLIKFSPFSPNCWVGVTATNREQYLTATGWRGLDGIRASVKYISFEPLLESIQPSEYRLKAVSWVIIGAMTCVGGDLAKLSSLYHQLTPMPYGKRYTLQPKKEWVEEIVRAADEAGVKVFLKNNLGGMDMRGDWDRDLWLGKNLQLRQEMPQGD